MEQGQITISHFENSVPPGVDAELESLYGHIYSSLPQFQIFDGLGSTTSTYLVQNDGRTIAALLFQLRGRKVHVLNEQIDLAPREINRFVRYLFEAYPAVDVISFHAVRTDPQQINHPVQHFYRTEDIVLTLPRTAEDYLNSLGKATRKNLKYHGNRLKRHYPELRVEVWENERIPAQYVRDVVELNRARMATKNKESEVDTEETERMIRLVQSTGLVCVMLIDGKVRAGTVCSRIGANYFMHFNAHDPAYDDARLGKLCCYRTICECIARGGKEFHFMWGRFEYKYLMLGVQRDYEELVIYRSRAQLLLNARHAVPLALNGYIREAKFRLLEIADQPEAGGFGVRLASRSLNYLRNLKRAGSVPAQKS